MCWVWSLTEEIAKLQTPLVRRCHKSGEKKLLNKGHARKEATAVEILDW